MEQLLRVQEVAEVFGVSSRAVWKWLYNRRVPSPVRIGRSVRWRAGDIEAFIRADCDMEQFEAERSTRPGHGG